MNFILVDGVDEVIEAALPKADVRAFPSVARG